jgi:hypothetical protein
MVPLQGMAIVYIALAFIVTPVLLEVIDIDVGAEEVLTLPEVVAGLFANVQFAGAYAPEN